LVQIELQARVSPGQLLEYDTPNHFFGMTFRLVCSVAHIVITGSYAGYHGRSALRGCGLSGIPHIKARDHQGRHRCWLRIPCTQLSWQLCDDAALTAMEPPHRPMLGGGLVISTLNTTQGYLPFKRDTTSTPTRIPANPVVIHCTSQRPNDNVGRRRTLQNPPYKGSMDTG